jgi:hypothetical protein
MHFAKRLLRKTMHTSPPVTAASLFLLINNEIMKYHEELKTSFVDIAEGQDALAILDPSSISQVYLYELSDGSQGLELKLDAGDRKPICKANLLPNACDASVY